MRINLLCSAVLAASLLPAQDTGRLSSVVVDPANAPVPGAKISLRIPGAQADAHTTVSGPEGLFRFTGLRPVTFDLIIEASGFQRYTLRAVKIDPGREISLPPQKIEIGAVTEVVEVTATGPGVQTTNAEISTTVSNEQLSRLPLFERSPINLIYTQAGVNFNGRTDTTINGLRTTYASVTVDGVNIQDNAVRANGLDFQPNLLLTDQVAEMTVITSNPGATVPGGAALISFSTPSGTNDFHGSLYWLNRNSALAANDWFNNRDGLGKARLNQNQGGASLGGRIIRDKLFFYTNYEGYRLKQQESANRTILTDTARRGLYRYRAGGAIREVNILQAARETIDPTIQGLLNQIPGPERINNFRLGDSTDGQLMNTGGYSFLIRGNRTRDNATAKLDYYLTERQSFSATWLWNRDLVDRPDQSNDYSPVPKMTNDDTRNMVSLTWRWSPRPSFTNEARFGFNLAPASFLTSEQFPPYFLEGLSFDYPVNTATEETRQTNTFNWQDNVTYVRGRHNVQFGFQAQNVRNEINSYFGITPTYAIAVGAGNVGLVPGQMPGIGSADFARANQMLATLAGLVEGYSQTFNVTSRTSGFVPGAPQIQHFRLDNYAAYVQDTWRLRQRLTLTLGLRWDYLTPVDERDGLVLLPVIQNNDVVSTLRSNMTLDFAGGAVGRPWYASDRNNWAPHVSLAWDPFGNGKTALRAGYGIFFVNEDNITTFFNSAVSNAGLQTTLGDSGLTARLSRLPRIPAPRFKVPRTAEDNNIDDPTNAHFSPDPELRTPYVQQWNVGIQHDIKGTVVDARYIGNHAVGSWRGIDYNQVVIRENGFLDDFLRARSNGFLAQQAGRGFDPRYNAAIPGSQPLTVFPRLDGGGSLTNATISTLIRQGQVGTLADTYQTAGQAGPVRFYRNPYSLGANLLTNVSHSSYHALQVEARRRVSSGLILQANYTFSKVLSDALGDVQNRFEPYLDFGNPSLERARAPFDITHSFKSNVLYDLPFGQGKRFFSGSRLRPVISGWSLGGLISYRSGAPFSILSARGTLNRSGSRSAGNTAIALLDGDGLDDLFGVRVTGASPYFIAATAIGPDGRGVATDGLPAFNGQAFYHPGPGTVGSLQRRMFTGPFVFDWDAVLAKETRIRERHLIIFRFEVYSIANNQAWYFGDQSIDSTTFGTIRSTATSPRAVQFNLKYQF